MEIDMDDSNIVCYWTYQDGQFCGGAFMYSSCGNGFDLDEPIPSICPSCGKICIERKEFGD